MAKASLALLIVAHLALGVSAAGAAPPSMSAAPPSMSAAPPSMSAAPPSMSAGPAMTNDAPSGEQTRRPTRWVVQRPTEAPSWLPVTVRAPRAVVRAPVGLERLAERLASAADEALARAATDLEGLPGPGVVEVRLVDQASELASVAPSGRGAPSYAVGVAYPDLGVVTIARRRGAEVQDAEATLRHELAHIALGVALGPDLPRWLHEGFAYQHSAEWSMDRTETLAGMVWLDSIIPLAQLDASFPAEEQATHRAYVQAYDFVGFLSRRGRWADAEDDGDRYPFRRFLAAIAAGRTIDDAAQLAFGRRLPALYTEWQEDLTNRLMLVPIGVFTFGLWLLATLLLVLAWRRRRRQRRATLERWAREEREAAAARAAAHPTVIAFEAAQAAMLAEEQAASEARAANGEPDAVDETRRGDEQGRDWLN